MHDLKTDKVTLYVYADHCSAAGQVVPTDSDGEYDFDELDASDDYIKYADCEYYDDIVADCHYVINHRTTSESAKRTARNILEYLDAGDDIA